jgi:hypothetical protein
MAITSSPLEKKATFSAPDSPLRFPTDADQRFAPRLELRKAKKSASLPCLAAGKTGRCSSGGRSSSGSGGEDVAPLERLELNSWKKVLAFDDNGILRLLARPRRQWVSLKTGITLFST